MAYVGIDLTSAFGNRPRAIDGAVLGQDLRVRYFQMHWPAADRVTQRDGVLLSQMIRQAAGIDGAEEMTLAVDGPQGLATPGSAMRQCERALGTPGHTPDTLPPPTNVGAVYMGGYIRSSIDFFAALAALGEFRLAGLDGAAAVRANLYEAFPGAEWTLLAGCRLDNKETPAGRRQRWDLLLRAGLVAPREAGLPTADQNDAAVAAYLAWCVRNAPPRVSLVGRPPARDGAELREGYMLHASRPLSKGDGETRTMEELPPDQETPPGVAPAADEWNDESCQQLRLIDDGIVHGEEPENAWMTTGVSYRCSTRPPHPRATFELRYAPTFAGGRGWRMSPTIPAMRRALGFPTPQHLSRAATVTLRVRARPMPP